MKTTISNVLTQIATQLNLDPQTLVDFAAEDTIGGFHADPTQRKWDVGSLWEVEGKVLYAIVRALKPEQVLEIGCFKGASSTHILTALEANGKGRLISVDIADGSGSGIPDALRQRWQFVNAETTQYISETPIRSDDVLNPEIVFEDAMHDFIGTRDILIAVRDNLSPRIVLSHDAEHFIVGKDVTDAWIDVFKKFQTSLIEPSDCGLAWKIFPV